MQSSLNEKSGFELTIEMEKDFGILEELQMRLQNIKHDPRSYPLFKEVNVRDSYPSFLLCSYRVQKQLLTTENIEQLIQFVKIHGFNPDESQYLIQDGPHHELLLEIHKKSIEVGMVAELVKTWRAILIGYEEVFAEAMKEESIYFSQDYYTACLQYPNWERGWERSSSLPKEEKNHLLRLVELNWGILAWRQKQMHLFWYGFLIERIKECLEVCGNDKNWKWWRQREKKHASSKVLLETDFAPGQQITFVTT